MAAFEIGQRVGDLREWKRLVGDYLQLALLDQPAQFGELDAARMHEEISITDTCPAGTRPDATADDPEQDRKNAATAEIPHRRLRLRKSGYRDDFSARLHDVEHL